MSESLKPVVENKAPHFDEVYKYVQIASATTVAIITTVAIGTLLTIYPSLSASYALVSQGGFYTQLYLAGLASSLAIFAVATCARSKKARAFRDYTLEKASDYMNGFRHQFFKIASVYGKHLESLTKSSSFVKREILSRFAAAGISIFSALELVQDLQHIAGHTINGTVSTLTKWQLPIQYPANYRNVALVAGETLTHLGGVLMGTFVGIVSPSLSRKLFLPSDQSFMENRPENMTKQQAGILYGMMHIVDDIFAKNEIQYAITAGTALGKERHGGIIPWDDDIDLFMLEEDEKKFLSLRKEFAKYDLDIIKCRLGYKVFYTKGNDVQEGDLKYKYPFIDVGIAIKSKSCGKIVYRDLHSRTTYSGEYYTYEEWNQLEKVEFGPITVSALKEGLPFVKRCYGIEAMEYGFTLLNHRTFSIEFPRKYFLNKNYKTKSGEVKCKSVEFDQNAYEKTITPSVSSKEV